MNDADFDMTETSSGLRIMGFPPAGHNARLSRGGRLTGAIILRIGWARKEN